jgi:N-acetylmuramate 1-kinase
MTDVPLEIFLADEAATSRLARILAPLLQGGDAVLLEGPIGAGKTHFARALIRARLGREEDVPSPTFTIVQTYEAEVDIWHADLYRLTHPDEARELGLEDAFETAICLVEWPDRLGFVPKGIRARFAVEGEGRRVVLDLGPRLTRVVAREWLLDRAGWADADRQTLAGDASARSYLRLVQGRESRILMDAPPQGADSVSDFVRIDRHLGALGLSAPAILAEDQPNGFLLLEDLGDGVFARLIDEDPRLEADLYRAAVDVLLHLQAAPPLPGLPDLSVGDWAEATMLVLDWYRFAITGTRDDKIRSALAETMATVLRNHADGRKIMILRDYHAENLMWLPERSGLARVGLLDFQLAQMGQPAYDLVSLLQDARRDVSPETERAMMRHFSEANGLTADRFAPAYAALGAQRALRIIGIFARLCLVERKPGYLRLIPRVWGHLQRNLKRPELSGLAEICAQFPPPTPENLKRIEGQCGAFQ